MHLDQLRAQLASSAFAFRGYNVTNLGRSDELLAHPRYGPIVESTLAEASAVGSEAAGRKMDLLARVRQRHETQLATYADAIALILAMEQAQIRILREQFEIEIARARMAFGFSLGEVAALTASGVFPMEPALQVLLAMAPDCIELAEGVTLGVLFTRARELPFDVVRRVCLEINSQGRGVIGPSAVLAPNSYLIMGQSDTLDRFNEAINKQVEDRVFLRKNEHAWPPLHTPIVWQRSIPNRAAQLMHSMDVNTSLPTPPVLSLVTGTLSYTELNVRELLHQWVDHPQRLWDAVYGALAMGVETVIHVGPAPNIIPATFQRLSDNVETQLKASLGLRAAASVVTRPWLKALAPARSALLRAPLVKHVILEDWLLEQPM